MLCVIPNSSVQSIIFKIRGLKCIWLQLGLILMHPKAKGQISGRPHRLFERTVIIAAGIFDYCVLQHPRAFLKHQGIWRDWRKGLPSPVFWIHQSWSLPGSGNGVGQRHLAVSDWDFGDSWDEPLPLMRLQQAGSTRRAARLRTFAWVKASQGSGWSWGCSQTMRILQECEYWQGQGQGLGSMAQEPWQHHSRIQYLRRRVTSETCPAVSLMLSFPSCQRLRIRNSDSYGSLPNSGLGKMALSPAKPGWSSVQGSSRVHAELGLHVQLERYTGKSGL